jgi:nucleotide-binding universal stress UspA family protein
MAISAIPVIAKVLMDLKLTRRDVGQTIIAAAMIDDTTGWILLSVVIGLAGGQAVTVGGVAESIFSVLVFLGISFTVGQWVVARLLRYTQTSVISRDKVLTLVVILMLAFGAVTHALHFEALLGAFVVGILFSRLPGFDVVVVHRLESITLGVFAPIFFAVAGLKVDIISLLEPELIAISLALIGIATVSKLAGIYVGARVLGGSDHWSALFYGAGLNARGSMGIIVATIGLSLGVLSQDMFSIIVLMAVVTSLVAPAALRYTFANIQAGEAELDRLRREELNQDNLVANTHRALLAVRWRDADFDDDTQRVEARILERMSTRTDLEITLFNVAYTVEQQKRGMSFLDRLAGMFSQQQLGRKVVVGDDPMRKILDEAERDYDLLILGASRSNNSSTTLFNPIVDQLMRLTPSSTIVVSGGHVDADWRPRRVLIPTNGSQAARRAAEVAFAITEEDSMAIVLTVVQTRQSSDYRLRSETLEMNQIQIAGQIVAELRELGELLTVQTLSEVVQGTDVSEQILKVAENEAVDLIVLGTNIRAGSDRLYLGPKVEQVLRDAPCPVVVVNAR